MDSTPIKIISSIEKGNKENIVEGRIKQLSVNKHRLSLNVHLDDPKLPLRELTKISETRATLFNHDIKFLKSVNKLNPYNETLLRSVQGYKNNITMSTKKRTKIKVQKNKNKHDKSQKTLFSYFKSQNVTKNVSHNDDLIIDCVRDNSKISGIDANSTKDCEVLKCIDLSEIPSSFEGTENGKVDTECVIDLVQSQIQESSQYPMIPSSQTSQSSKRSSWLSSFEMLVEVDPREASLSNPPPNWKFMDNNFLNKTKFFSGGRNKKTKICPPCKLIKGTSFAVDAFSYGEIPDVEIYFLTHFHSDHYMGLNKTFNKPIYCSQITAELCKQRLRVKSSCIQILEMDTAVEIQGVHVSAVDANHCPGAIMLVFSLPSGKNILHCGDFRASSFMESYPVFWNKEIHTIHLDTTYCNPQYMFPTQSESINDAISIIRKKKAAMEAGGKSFEKLLIVCGTYTIGKEKFFMGISKELSLKVWVPADKNSVLKIVTGQDFHSNSAKECQIHVLPMGKIQYNSLVSYLKTMDATYEEILAFKPTGWELSKNSLIQRGNVTIHGISYSEHSSFQELQRFVKFLQPQHIIPTVPAHGGSSAMQKYFSCWLGNSDQKAQRRVSDYFNICDKR